MTNRRWRFKNAISDQPGTDRNAIKCKFLKRFVGSAKINVVFHFQTVACRLVEIHTHNVMLQIQGDLWNIYCRTGCFTTLPVGLKDSTARLEAIEKNLADLKTSTFPLTM
jgi:hypothetical protein